MCLKRFSNLTHTVYFDVSIYRQIGEPDVTDERMTHLLILDTFFHTHDAQIHEIGEPDVMNERMTHLLKLDTFFRTHDA